MDTWTTWLPTFIKWQRLQLLMCSVQRHTPWKLLLAMCKVSCWTKWQLLMSRGLTLHTVPHNLNWSYLIISHEDQSWVKIKIAVSWKVLIFQHLFLSQVGKKVEISKLFTDQKVLIKIVWFSLGWTHPKCFVLRHFNIKLHFLIEAHYLMGVVVWVTDAPIFPYGLGSVAILHLTAFDLWATL